MAQATLQKLLPRDPIDDILKSSPDTHIRTLLRNLCQSSPEMKEKAQRIHQRILESIPPPPPLNLAGSDIAIIANYNSRKRKFINGTGETYTGYNDRFTGSRGYRGARRSPVGRPDSGFHGEIYTRKKGYYQAGDANSPVSPRTKFPVGSPTDWYEWQGQQMVYPLTSAENTEAKDEDYRDSKRICLPSLSDAIFKKMNHSLTLPPLLGFHENNVGQMGPREPEVDHSVDVGLRDLLEGNVPNTTTVDLNSGNGEEVEEVELGERKESPTSEAN